MVKGFRISLEIYGRLLPTFLDFGDRHGVSMEKSKQTKGVRFETIASLLLSLALKLLNRI